MTAEAQSSDQIGNFKSSRARLELNKEDMVIERVAISDSARSGMLLCTKVMSAPRLPFREPLNVPTAIPCAWAGESLLHHGEIVSEMDNVKSSGVWFE